MSVQAIAWVLEHEHTTTGTDRLVLLSIANHAGPEVDVLVDGEYRAAFESWPGIERISAEANVSRRQTVKDSLKRLQTNGVLYVVVNGAPDRRMRGDRRTNLYRIVVDEPATSGGTPDVPPSIEHGGSLPVATGARLPRSRGLASRSHGGTPGEPLTVSEPSEQPSVEPSLSLVHDPSERVVDFGAFWNVYPKKADVGAARKAWKAATKKARPLVIVEAAERYRDDPNREAGYTKNPATWLNAESWLNGPLEPRARSSATPAPIDNDRAAAGGVLDL